jgi:hypothetical protein
MTATNGHRPAVQSVRLPDLDARQVLAAVREGAYSAVSEHLQARPLDVARWGDTEVRVTSQAIADVFADDDIPDRTVKVRGIAVYADDRPRVTFANRPGVCPSCESRVKLRDKLVGFTRMDRPDLLLWICRHCANRLVRGKA